MEKSNMHIKNDKIRAVVTLAIGMLVTLWRVFLPQAMEVTKGIVILVACLDIVLTATIIFINRYELKDIFSQKYDRKFFIRVLISYIVLLFASIVVVNLIYIGLDALVATVPTLEFLTKSPGNADKVATQFQAIFPQVVFISMVICAPIFEEIVFRMSVRKLFKNPIIYLIISCLLFSFIHTASLITFLNTTYIVLGGTLALIYLITKDIRVVMLTHLLANLTGRIIAIINS